MHSVIRGIIRPLSTSKVSPTATNLLFAAEDGETSDSKVKVLTAEVQLAAGENAEKLKMHMRSLHEGGEATSWSVPAAPYCQRLHKQQQLYDGGNCY